MKKLITLLIPLMLFNCVKDDCVKKATKEKVVAGMAFKSSSSKTTDTYVNSRETPLWLDWEGRNINLDSISGWTLSGMHRNADSSYYVKSWVGFRSSITIPYGKEFHVRSLNMIIKGDIYGSGTIIFESYQDGKEYNTPIGAKLVVEGSIDDSVNLIMNDNTTLELGQALGDYSFPNEKYITEVDCSFELPQKVLENGIWWLYREYDGAGVRLDAGTYKGKL